LEFEYEHQIITRPDQYDFTKNLFACHTTDISDELNWVAEILTNHQHATPLLTRVYAYEVWHPDACGNHEAIDARLALPDKIESEAILLAVKVDIELYRNLDHSKMEVIDPYASENWYEEDFEYTGNTE
jgi:hypothetical protein